VFKLQLKQLRLVASANKLVFYIRSAAKQEQLPAILTRLNPKRFTGHALAGVVHVLQAYFVGVYYRDKHPSSCRCSCSCYCVFSRLSVRSFEGTGDLDVGA